jgi:hypothetical protein
MAAESEASAHVCALSEGVVEAHVLHEALREQLASLRPHNGPPRSRSQYLQVELDARRGRGGLLHGAARPHWRRRGLSRSQNHI